MRFSVASWNIGGGILGESHQIDGESQLNYHASIISATDPDIVCLQEAHEYASGESQAEHLAKLTRYPYHLTIRLSASHLASDAWLSLAVLSKYPISAHSLRMFPRLDFRAIGPNGRDWVMHDKGYIILTIELESGLRLKVLNAHCFPFHHFTSDPPNSDHFYPVWETLRNDLRALLSDTYSVVTIDLNYPTPEELLGDLIGSRSFIPTFIGTPTKPSGVQHDFILQGPGLQASRFNVMATEADHSYCFAEFETIK